MLSYLDDTKFIFLDLKVSIDNKIGIIHKITKYKNNISFMILFEDNTKKTYFKRDLYKLTILEN